MAKIGRPCKENPIMTLTSVRIDTNLSNELNAYCATHNVSKGSVVRESIKLFFETQKDRKP